MKRAASANGPFTTIATTSATSYLNTGLANGTTYHYVVSSVNAGRKRGFRVGQRHANDAHLGESWRQADVGPVGRDGFGQTGNGSFSFKARARTWWYAADELRVYPSTLTNVARSRARAMRAECDQVFQSGRDDSARRWRRFKHAFVDVTPTTELGVEFIRRITTAGALPPTAVPA